MTKTIKHLLIDKDLTIADLARKINRSRVWTSYVINGHMKSPATRKAIAQALGARVEDLWENGNNKRAA
jgi:transcriptional regulator with XRE-family HTH domain